MFYNYQFDQLCRYIIVTSCRNELGEGKREWRRIRVLSSEITGDFGSKAVWLMTTTGQCHPSKTLLSGIYHCHCYRVYTTDIVIGYIPQTLLSGIYHRHCYRVFTTDIVIGYIPLTLLSGIYHWHCYRVYTTVIVIGYIPLTLLSGIYHWHCYRVYTTDIVIG